MNTNKILNQIITPVKTTLRVLDNIFVNGGKIQVTDLDYFFTLKNSENIKDGFYSIATFKKTKDLGIVPPCYDLSPSDFPEMSDHTHAKGCKNIYPDFIKKAYSGSSFASKDFMVRVALTGSYISPKTGKVCSTDGHRLAEGSIPKQDIEAFIISPNHLRILKILEENFDLEYMVSEGLFVAKNSEVFFSCRLMEGPYPDYAKALKESDKSHMVELSPDGLEIFKISLKKLLPLTDGTKRLTISGNVIFQADTLTGCRLPFCIKGEISLNGEYLAEALKGLKTPKICNVGDRLNIHQGGDNYIVMALRDNGDDLDVSQLKFIPLDLPKKKSKNLTRLKILEIIQSNKNKSGSEILEMIKSLEN